MKDNVVILADGDFPVTEYPHSILRSADKIICCDASVLKLKQNTSLECYRIAGDMDTLPPHEYERYKDIVVQEREQETNDLSKAFRFAMTLDPESIIILGATGHREDHTLGNISLLADYSALFPNIRMVTDYGTFIPYNDSFSMEAERGSIVSIFCFDQSVQIKSSGLEYSTDKVVFDRWWKATLNRVVSSPFSLELSHPAPVLIYVPQL